MTPGTAVKGLGGAVPAAEGGARLATSVEAANASGGAPPATAAASAVASWHRVALWVAGIELLLLYAPTLAWLFDRWTLSVWHHAHGLLIPPVVGYFAYQELRPLRHLPVRPSAWGFVLFVPALALRALDAGIHTELLSAVSLLIALPGLSLLALGVPRTRAIAFPLAFLVFALPIPLALTEPVHWQLRQIATAATAAIVPMLGIPVLVEGTTLHMARATLVVADACSGFSTLYASLAVACLTAYSSTSRARRALVLMAAAPIAIAVNALRVVLLVVLVVWQGHEILETPVHSISGMLTFALALPIILWLGSDSRRSGQ
jgi:exosortase